MDPKQKPQGAPSATRDGHEFKPPRSDLAEGCKPARLATSPLHIRRNPRICVICLFGWLNRRIGAGTIKEP